METKSLKIAVIGGGNMGAAIAAGVVRAGTAEAENVIVSHPKQGQEALLAGMRTTRDNREAARGADMVLLCVKPWLMEQVSAEIAEVIDPQCQTVVSVAAGVDFATLAGWFRDAEGRVPALFRAVPNTAVGVGLSMTFIAAADVAPERSAEVCRVFGAVGEVCMVGEEMIPAVTALASCGIAYIFKYIEAAIRGGEDLGLDREMSRRAVLKTVEGALAVLRAGGHEPAHEIGRVTTPGGITLRGLARMEECGFSDAVIEGLKASRH